MTQRMIRIIEGSGVLMKKGNDARLVEPEGRPLALSTTGQLPADFIHVRKIG